jgi:hypothetical protein
MHGLRNLVESHSNPRTWQRLKTEIGKLDITANMRYNPVTIATNHLNDYLIEGF